MSKLFKVTLKQGSKSSSVVLEANSWESVLSFLQAVTTQKVVEIYEICYQSPTEVIPVDDFNYHTSYSAMIYSNSNMWQVKLWNIKKTLSSSEMETLIKTYLKCKGQTPDRIFVEGYKTKL